MTPKPKRDNPLWSKCERCGCSISSKDSELHSTSCPPSNKDFSHSFIRDSVLHGKLELKKNDEIKGVSMHDRNNFVFLSESAIQLCGFVIGEPVVITAPNLSLPKCVMTVWPTVEGSLGAVLVTKKALNLQWSTSVHVIVSKFSYIPYPAKEIILVVQNASKTLELSSELITRIHKGHVGRFVTEGNKVNIMYYGKDLIFKIESISFDETQTELEKKFAKLEIESASSSAFYQVCSMTRWKLFESTEKYEKQNDILDPFINIGGLDKEISELSDIINFSLKNSSAFGLKFSRAVLLYGPSGTGKTLLANSLAKSSKANVFCVSGSDIFNKFLAETESNLRDIFQEAIFRSPSIIVLDGIDILCPARSSRITDQEKKVACAVSELFEKMALTDTCRVFVIATSSRPDSIDPTFRRWGRLDREIEIPSPNPRARLEVLQKLLRDVKHNIDEDSLSGIARITHGFVGSDLASLCSRAAMNAARRSSSKLETEDLKFALTRVRPSAMREVQVEVPDVRWSDIGGQNELKLALKQAVEWPLKYPQSFVRMGITPPKGILMFGPPGCSKTMIAKAIATESGLNFLSIKGPELFSKWVGESERAIRDVFKKARQVAPSVVFFDELDALGGERTSGSSSGGTNVQERVLAQLLTELDGVSPLGEVTVLAATNRPDRIDKALLRPGRLDRILYVPLPNDQTRKEIFKIKLAKMPVTNVSLDLLVDLTSGYSGAEVQAVCHEAAMKALEKNIEATEITAEHFKEALTIVTPRTSLDLLQVYENYLKK